MDNTKIFAVYHAWNLANSKWWASFYHLLVVWFNLASTSRAACRENLCWPFNWGNQALFILNVALTIPARVAIGVNRPIYPRLVYSSLLAVCSIPCFMFAMADSFIQAAIARFLLGFIGAEHGIRLLGPNGSHKWTGHVSGAFTAAGVTSVQQQQRSHFQL